MYPNDMSAKVATQTPVISIEFQRLEKTQAELSEMVAALESRLAVAMREPEPSQIRPDNPGVAPAQSQLAIMLRQRVSEAEGLAYRLSSILRRLEI
jgi:hypothetical protein